MAEAMLRIEAEGPWQIVLSVHDELIAERDTSPTVGGSLKEFRDLMETLPDWANVKAAGWTGRRYKK